MLFADLVAFCGVVEKLESRQDKADRVMSWLRDAPPTDLPVIVELLTRADLFDDSATTRVAAVAPRRHVALTCLEVADALADIEQTPDGSRRNTLIRDVMRQATIDEQRWIGDAVVGGGHDRRTFDLIVSAAAAATRVTVGRLRRAATLTASLALSVRIAREDGDTGLESVTLEPGRPIPPTLPDGVEPARRLLEDPPSRLIEWNLAADRIQVHRRQGEVSVYDDQLEDVTEAVPIVVDQVSSFAVGDLVLDGWVDLDPGRTSDCLTTFTRTARPNVERTVGEAVFFDLLFNGTPVVDEPLAVRRQLLTSVVPHEFRLPTVDVDDLDDLAASVNDCLWSRHVGLILKPLDAPYEGGLVRSSWRQIESAHIVNLVVVAAERGSGSKSHLLSKVRLAARDGEGFREVARTARGLSQEMIVQQTAEFLGLVIDSRGGGSRRLIRLRPEVIAVAAIDGVAESRERTAELALRRPRLIGYERRTSLDDMADVTTVEELWDIARADLGVGETTDPAGSPGRLHRSNALREPSDIPRAVASMGVSVTPATSGGDVGAPLDSSDGSNAGTGVPDAASGRTSGSENAGEHDSHEASAEPVGASVRPTSGWQASGWQARSVLVARVAALVWVAAILLAALNERSTTSAVDGSTAAGLGRMGMLVTSLLIVTGWAWCDQLLRSTVRPDLRVGRLRCAMAWLSLPLLIVAISLVVVPLEPTEPVDIRTALLVTLFSLAMWQPYALIRRLLPTLSKLRSDTLIVPAYVIDVMSFGILWWQLALWGDGVGVSQGEVDVLVGALAAVAISMALNIVVWVGLLATARNATSGQRPSEQAGATADHVPMTVDPVLGVDGDHDVAARQFEDDESDRSEHQPAAEFGEGLQAEPVRSGDDTSDVGGPTGRGADVRDVPVPGEPARGLRSSDSDGDVDDPIEAMRRQAAERTPGERPARDGGTHAERPRPPDTGRAAAGGADPVRPNDATDDSVPAESGEGAEPPRLFLVSAVGLVMVGTFGALTLVAAWLVSLSLGSDAIAGTSELPSSVVTDLELARTTFWHLLTIGAALLAIWSLVIVQRASRAGIPGLRMRRVLILALVAVAACVGGFVVDASERGVPTLLLCVPIIWSAVAAGFCVEPIRAWFELPKAPLTAWITTLPVILVLAWLAGLSAPIEATASLQRLAFTTILLTLGCARITVMSVLSSLDIERRLRTRSELSAPTARATSG